MTYSLGFLGKLLFEQASYLSPVKMTFYSVNTKVIYFKLECSKLDRKIYK